MLVGAEVVALLRGGGVPKGDAIAVARIAGHPGRQAHARTWCRCATRSRSTGSRSTSEVERTTSTIEATVRTADRTGVEMEALTCVAVAGLALIDMVKAVDPAAVISDVRVEEKTGGKTGVWRR